MNHTQNYQLSQWEATDKVQRVDFNADNAKIDAALKAQADTLAGKASSSTVSSLQSTVAGHTTALAKKGNCQFYTTSYTGREQCGKDNPTSLSFPKRPMVVFIADGSEHMTLLRGAPGAVDILQNGTRTPCTVSWSGNTVSWYSSDIWSQMNMLKTYPVIALLEA